MEEARRLRAEAEALKAPQAGELDSVQATVAFIRGPLAEWLKARRALIERATAAHTRASRGAPRDMLAELAFEHGDMKQRFVSEYVAAISAAVPRSKRDAMQGFEAAARDSAHPMLEDARASFEICATAASEFPKLAQLKEKCALRLREVSELIAPQDQPLILEASEVPAIQSTTYPSPCTFRGSLSSGSMPLFASADAKQPVARVGRAEVEELVLPKAREGRAQVRLSWPVQGTFWVTAPALALQRKVTLVPGRIWLDRGAQVWAEQRGEGRALVSRRGLENESQPTPEFSKELPCSELTLAGSVPAQPVPHAGVEKGLQGKLTLHASPRGKQIGQIEIRTAIPVRVLEGKDGWLRIVARVSSFNPSVYDFDAWTESALSDLRFATEFGAIANAKAATHRTLRAVEVFVGDKSRVSLAKVPPGVSLLVGAERDGYLQVALPQAWPFDAKSFWIRTADRAALQAQ